MPRHYCCTCGRRIVWTANYRDVVSIERPQSRFQRIARRDLRNKTLPSSVIEETAQRQSQVCSGIVCPCLLKLHKAGQRTQQWPAATQPYKPCGARRDALDRMGTDRKLFHINAGISVLNHRYFSLFLGATSTSVFFGASS